MPLLLFARPYTHVKNKDSRETWAELTVVGVWDGEKSEVNCSQQQKFAPNDQIHQKAKLKLHKVRRAHAGDREAHILSPCTNGLCTSVQMYIVHTCTNGFLHICLSLCTYVHCAYKKLLTHYSQKWFNNYSKFLLTFWILQTWRNRFSEIKPDTTAWHHLCKETSRE